MSEAQILKRILEPQLAERKGRKTSKNDTTKRETVQSESDMQKKNND